MYTNEKYSKVQYESTFACSIHRKQHLVGFIHCQEPNVKLQAQAFGKTFQKCDKNSGTSCVECQVSEFCPVDVGLYYLPANVVFDVSQENVHQRQI